jgi:hypothetical protein
VAEAVGLLTAGGRAAIEIAGGVSFLTRDGEESRWQSELLRCIFGKPFRPPPAIDPAWFTWGNDTVKHLALAAYEERELPSGHLGPARLGVLADALTDAGCTDADLLDHLRGPRPHVRGCFVVDLLTGRG